MILLLSELFGRDEFAQFEFSQQHVDDLLSHLHTQLAGTDQDWAVPLESWCLEGLVSLCVSDANKGTLLKSDRLIGTLLLGLFLDKHPRGSNVPPTQQAADPAVQTHLQQRSVEAFGQLALSEIGRAALLQHSAVVPALQVTRDPESTYQPGCLVGAGVLT